MHTPNRKVQRRRYLTRKAVALGKQMAGHLLFSVATMVVVCSLMLMSLLAFATLVWPASGIGVMFAALTASSLIAGLAAFGCDRLISSAELEEARIPNVAMLKPDELPAGEVLVRMSRRPLDDREALLLASSCAPEIDDTDQLLRPVQNRSTMPTSAKLFETANRDNLPAECLVKSAKGN